MNTITTARRELADLVRATGLAQGHPFPPERVVPPAAIVTEGAPLVEAETGTWGYRVRLVVRLVVPTGSNEAMTEALDELVAAAVQAVEADDFDVPTVGQFVALEANGASYLSTELTATTLVDRLTTTT